ncbi:MAG: RNA-binding protein [Desulfobacterales bacterium]
MGMNIYVGNLSYKISSTDLHAIFEPFGTVANAKVVNDRDTGRSKGFGFVEMESAEDGQKAIDALNGKEIQGRALKVSQANPPQKDRGDRGGRGDRDDRRRPRSSR